MGHFIVNQHQIAGPEGDEFLVTHAWNIDVGQHELRVERHQDDDCLERVLGGTEVDDVAHRIYHAVCTAVRRGVRGHDLEEQIESLLGNSGDAREAA